MTALAAEPLSVAQEERAAVIVSSLASRGYRQVKVSARVKRGRRLTWRTKRHYTSEDAGQLVQRAVYVIRTGVVRAVMLRGTDMQVLTRVDGEDLIALVPGYCVLKVEAGERA